MQDKVIQKVTKTVNVATSGVSAIEKEFNSLVNPIRKTAFERFPALFTLLTAFGVAAVFFGFERLISEISWLNERPLLIVLVGVATLLFTGSLYKRLGKII